VSLIGGFGNDRLAALSTFGQRATLPVTFQGGEGNDTLFGGDANDLMLGGDGDDFANSVEGGADVITGDAGTDDPS
jgi:Ca2+-binding RTX toxin-like protein